MTGHYSTTEATRRVERAEKIYSGPAPMQQMTQSEDAAYRNYSGTDGQQSLLTRETVLQRRSQAGGDSLEDERQRAIARQQLQTMRPKLTSLRLFRRRHTGNTVNLRSQRLKMEQLSADVSQEALHNATARKSELAPLSRRERKDRQEELEKPEIESFQTATEKVNEQFADKNVVSTAWAKEHVLDKKTSIHTDKGTEEVTQEALFKEVLRTGDCSNLEKLDPVLRNLAAAKYMQGISFQSRVSSPEEVVNTLFKSGGAAALMHPLFRLGISIMARGGTLQGCELSGKNKTFYAKIEDLCNQRIMSATMYSAPKLKDQREPDELARNKTAQIFMMKNLLMCHLGKMQQVDTVKDPKTKKIISQTTKSWPHGMATAFAHCSRVAFSMPTPTAGDDAMLGDLMKTRKGEHGFKTRPAATHKLTRKRKTAGSMLIEGKPFITNLLGQYGMNVAVGGLDNDGVPGQEGKMRQIKNDGSGGHIFMHVDKGDADSYTGLLVGFESDAPGVYNQTGHKHGPGNPEFMSSFGGLRVDEIGDKYGGRQVDLTGFTGDSLQDALNEFETRMTALMNKAHNLGATNDDTSAAMSELMNVCDMLSGTQMTDEQLRYVMGDTAYQKLQKTGTQG